MKQNVRSLVGTIKGYPMVKILYMNTSEIIEALAKNVGELELVGKISFVRVIQIFSLKFQSPKNTIGEGVT